MEVPPSEAAHTRRSHTKVPAPSSISKLSFTRKGAGNATRRRQTRAVEAYGTGCAQPNLTTCVAVVTLAPSGAEEIPQMLPRVCNELLHGLFVEGDAGSYPGNFGELAHAGLVRAAHRDAIRHLHRWRRCRLTTDADRDRDANARHKQARAPGEMHASGHCAPLPRPSLG